VSRKIGQPIPVRHDDVRHDAGETVGHSAKRRRCSPSFRAETDRSPGRADQSVERMINVGDGGRGRDSIKEHIDPPQVDPVMVKQRHSLWRSVLTRGVGPPMIDGRSQAGRAPNRCRM